MVIKNSDLELKVSGLDTGSFSHYLYGVEEVTLTLQASVSFSQVYHWNNEPR